MHLMKAQRAVDLYRVHLTFTCCVNCIKKLKAYIPYPLQTFTKLIVSKYHDDDDDDDDDDDRCSAALAEPNAVDKVHFATG